MARTDANLIERRVNRAATGRAVYAFLSDAGVPGYENFRVSASLLRTD